MREQVSLPPGREFERYVLGVSGSDEFFTKHVGEGRSPGHNFDFALKEVVEKPLAKTKSKDEPLWYKISKYVDALFGVDRSDEGEFPKDPLLPLTVMEDLDEIGLDLDLYDPLKPNWGCTKRLWQAVNGYLPRRSCGFKSGPLSLHISVDTRLDLHGVDVFFWWMGGYVTVDVSLIDKRKERHGDEHLKADFLLSPEDLTSEERLESFGQRVASLLKERRRKTKKKRKSKPVLCECE